MCLGWLVSRVEGLCGGLGGSGFFIFSFLLMQSKLVPLSRDGPHACHHRSSFLSIVQDP